MPKPRKDENRKDWMDRCIPVLVSEGASQNQAVAVCAQMWRDRTMQQGDFVLYRDEIHILGGRLAGGKVRLFKIGEWSGDGLKMVTVPFADVSEYRTAGGMVRAVEIFRTGVWNGDRYTLRDLQDMVDAFGKTGFRVPVKLGHAENSGDPAFGWVTDLRLEGETLVADFENVPKDVIEMIRDKRFGAVSAEIFWNLERDGKKFRRALKAVALLGAETPGVGDLRPLFEAQFARDKYSRIVQLTVSERNTMRTVAEIKAALAKETDAEKRKELTEELEKAIVKENDQPNDDRLKTLEEQNAELRKNWQDTEVKHFRDAVTIPSLRPYAAELFRLSLDDTRIVEFSTGEGDPQKLPMRKIIEGLFEQIGKLADKNLFTELAANDPADERRAAKNAKTAEQAGNELDRLAKEIQRKEKLETYDEAFERAQADNPQLAKLYAQV